MKDRQEYREWHRLFDCICNQRGYYDNTDLAGMFCARAGRNRQEDFEAAKKRLQSWRTGKRLPRRANLEMMSSILGIDEDPALHAHWNTLYRTARYGWRDQDAGHSRTPLIAAPRRSPLAYVALAALAMLCVGFAGTVATSSREDTFAHLPGIGYDASVRLPLGTSRLIHGEHGQCGGPAPSWDEIRTRIPATDLGRFADGGLARKMVNECGEEVAVRAVMFTAARPGIEETVLLGDYMRIEVFERSESGGDR